MLLQSSPGNERALAAGTGEGGQASMGVKKRDPDIISWRSMGNTHKMETLIRAKPSKDKSLGSTLPGGWGSLNGIVKRPGGGGLCWSFLGLEFM